MQLIVSEIEEAPHQYPTAEHKAYFRKFMRDRVQRTVEAKEFPYVRADVDQLMDEDYFNYNHLNSRGIERFTPLLAKKLRDVIISNSRFQTAFQQNITQQSPHQKLSK